MRLPADATPSWIFAPEIGAPGSGLTLSAEESRYVSRVCRGRVGDRLTATDGRGATATLRLLHLGSRVRAEVESRSVMSISRQASLLCGAPEGQRADWLVEKLCELGISVWQPVDCERSVWAASRIRVDRWNRLAIASLRQSRRSFRLEIRHPEPLGKAIEELAAGSKRWLADAAGPAPPARPEQGMCVGAVGPASGFSARDRGLLDAGGFRPISLSDSRLRTETAAFAWAAWWGIPGPQGSDLTSA